METSSFSGILMIAAIAIVGAVSPGPDFVMVTKNSLTYSRRTGLYTAFGVSLGVLFHITYCILGIGFFIADSPFLFNCIKYAGAAYLVFLGLKSIFAKQSSPSKLNFLVAKEDLTPFQAAKMGFFTNALNPKATLYFLSIFSQAIDPQTTWITKSIYAFEFWFIGWAWFCFLAFILSHPNLRIRLMSIQHYFEKTMGGILIAFGLKIALA